MNSNTTREITPDRPEHGAVRRVEPTYTDLFNYYTGGVSRRAEDGGRD